MTTWTAPRSCACTASRLIPASAPSASSRAGTSARPVGVHRPGAAVVSGVECGQHLAHLRATDLADDQPVGPHPQRLPHEVHHRHAADALDVGHPPLEPHDVGVRRRQLAHVLDDDDPFIGGALGQQRPEHRGLADAGPTDDDERQPGRHHPRSTPANPSPTAPRATSPSTPTG